MATNVKNVDELSDAERKMIVNALELSQASVLRAMRAEKDDDIGKLRGLQAEAIGKLVIKFR